MTDLTAVSLFDGIGGIHLALKRAGVRVVAGVEIDPACRSVLARHFPGAVLFNDVTEVTGDQLRAAGFVPGRGILAGGWPCTGNSIAGRREGMADPRSGLWVQFARLLAELRPRWFLGENVPGLYSVNDGRDIAIVRRDLAQLGYWWAERTLDAQHFGVPQRRARVFFAGCLGERAAPVQVLFEPEGGDRDSAPGGQTGQGAAGGAANGTGSPRTVGTLGTTGPGGGWRVGADEAAAGQLVANTAYTVHAAESCAKQRHAFETTTAHSLDTTGGFASNQGGTLIASTLQGGGRRGHRVDAEGASGGHLVLAQNGSDIQVGNELGALTAGMARQTSGDLIATAPLPSRDVSHAITSREGKGADSDATSGLVMIAHTLTSEGFDASEDGTGRGIPIVPTGMPQNQAHAAGLPVEVRAFNGQTGGVGMLGYGDKPTALQASQVTDIHQGMAVRRLTPMECERLQGFPDGWTRYLADGTEQSDSARYRQCGNAVAVPVVEWLTRRLVAADAVLGESEAVA